MTATEYTLLQLKLPDVEPTPINPPMLQPKADIKLSLNGVVEILGIKPAGGASPTKSEYGVGIFYGVVGSPLPHGIASVPESANFLPKSAFTRQKKHKFDFYEDKGRQVFFCLRYENSKGVAGPWGNMLSAYIS